MRIHSTGLLSHAHSHDNMQNYRLLPQRIHPTGSPNSYVHPWISLCLTPYLYMLTVKAGLGGMKQDMEKQASHGMREGGASEVRLELKGFVSQRGWGKGWGDGHTDGLRMFVLDTSWKFKFQ